MSEQQFIGWLVIGLATLTTLFIAIVKPIIALNTNLTKLNSNFETMNEKGIKRDEAIIDLQHEQKQINKVQYEHKLVLKNHEQRIEKLEERRN